MESNTVGVKVEGTSCEPPPPSLRRRRRRRRPGRNGRFA